MSIKSILNVVKIPLDHRSIAEIVFLNTGTQLGTSTDSENTVAVVTTD
jgi:hypothetical protein